MIALLLGFLSSPCGEISKYKHDYRLLISQCLDFLFLQKQNMASQHSSRQTQLNSLSQTLNALNAWLVRLGLEFYDCYWWFMMMYHHITISQQQLYTSTLRLPMSLCLELDIKVVQNQFEILSWLLFQVLCIVRTDDRSTINVGALVVIFSWV